jgi:hypothetical protein
MAGVGAVASIVGTGAQLIGKGIALRKQKKAAGAEAAYITRLGRQEEREFRESGEEFKREQRAALGAAGAVMGAGSPLALQAETARKIEEDAMKIRREYQYRAKQVKRKGAAEMAAGIAGMGTTFLSGLGQTYGFGQEKGWWK